MPDSPTISEVDGVAYKTVGARLDAIDGKIQNVPAGTVVLSGLLSERPAPGMEGRLYLATDEAGGTLYRDDTASWQRTSFPTTRQGAGTFTTTYSSSFVAGYAKNTGVIRASERGSAAIGAAWGSGALLESTGRGSFAAGEAGGEGTLRSAANGSVALGFGDYQGYVWSSGNGSLASGYAYYDGATVKASGDGSFATGIARNGGVIEAVGNGALASGYVSEDGKVTSSDNGAFAGGHVYGVLSEIKAYGYGATARGAATGGGFIYAEGYGAFAVGWAYGTGAYMHANQDGAHAWGFANWGSTIEANNPGCFAGGYATGTNSVIRSSGGRGAVAFGSIYTSGQTVANAHGAFVHGRVRAAGSGKGITASGVGSQAWGHAYGANADILASGSGSSAQGYATTGQTISATASNAHQFGVGTNALADSLSVGTTMRLKGTTGAPGTPRNGDLWVNNNYVYIRSNGASKKIV